MILIIYLDDNRRRIGPWASKFQHFCAGVPLLFIGLQKLFTDEAERPIALLEVAIATCVVVTFFKELHAERRHAAKHPGAASHSSVGWFDLAAGFLLMFEAFHGIHRKPGICARSSCPVWLRSD